MNGAVARRLEAELGRRVRLLDELGRPRPERRTWAAEAEGLGDVVVKARHEDWAAEKTRWAAGHLPLLARRGHPVPEIIWHGQLGEGWYGVVQSRLPGTPLRAIDRPLVDSLLELVELQADAHVDPAERNFAEYQALVLFDGWDGVWPEAEAVAPELSARMRGWLEPFWGHRLPPADFANNDLNLTNVLVDGHRITGVVDWDEFGLNSRGADLAALAFDCELLGEAACADHFLKRIAEISGEAGLRCLVAYRALAHVVALARRGGPAPRSAAAATRVLDRLGG
jgi:Phosphotransferase enzyme family